MPSKADALAAKINALSPPDRLRLAAMFIERGDHRTAEILAQAVVHELQARRLLDAAKGREVKQP